MDWKFGVGDGGREGWKVGVLEEVLRMFGMLLLQGLWENDHDTDQLVSAQACMVWPVVKELR